MEVEAFLISERYGIRGTIAFVIDTGSQKTILGARDAETLAFPTEAFVPYAGPPMFGIGGRGTPMDVGPCQIVLGTGALVGRVDLIYFAPEREITRKTKAAGARHTRRRVFALPSLLGTDFLSENRCTLTVDWGRRTGEVRFP